MTEVQGLGPPVSLAHPRAFHILRFLVDDRGVGARTLEATLHRSPVMDLVFYSNGEGTTAGLTVGDAAELVLSWRYPQVQEGLEALESADLLPRGWLEPGHRRFACDCLIGALATTAPTVAHALVLAARASTCVQCGGTGWTPTFHSWRLALGWVFLDPTWVLGIEEVARQGLREVLGALPSNYRFLWFPEVPDIPPDRLGWPTEKVRALWRFTYDALRGSGVPSAFFGERYARIDYPSPVRYTPWLRSP